MILIPEIETVVILVPRTGSGSLRRAIARRYPKSVLLYRHMEADGTPHGYDRWRKVGVLREPICRLWSLYKFMGTFTGPNGVPDQGPAYVAAMRRSVQRPFSDWIVENETVFTSPYDSGSAERFYPGYTVRHPLPENRKSQFIYLRPDLGTEIVPYEQLPALAARLDVDLPQENATALEPPPTLSAPAMDHLRRFHGWDLAHAEAWL